MIPKEKLTEVILHDSTGAFINRKHMPKPIGHVYLYPESTGHIIAEKGRYWTCIWFSITNGPKRYLTKDGTLIIMNDPPMINPYVEVISIHSPETGYYEIFRAHLHSSTEVELFERYKNKNGEWRG